MEFPFLKRGEPAAPRQWAGDPCFSYLSERLDGGTYPYALALFLLAFPLTLQAQEYNIFNPVPDLERTADGKWKVNDTNRPMPPKVDPKPESELAGFAKAPVGAMELLDATLSKWRLPQPWQFHDGILEIIPGQKHIETVEAFGSCRLHVEWSTPPESDRAGQDRGNSGIIFMGNYEVQVLDTFDNPTYADGIAASLYGAKPPDANALRPAGQWQYFDIWFRRPTFDAAGAMVTPATVTIYVNGILAQKNVPYEGPSSHKRRIPYRKHSDKLPMRLQYHNESVKFRNLWIVPLEDEKVISPDGPVGISK